MTQFENLIKNFEIRDDAKNMIWDILKPITDDIKKKYQEDYPGEDTLFFNDVVLTEDKRILIDVEPLDEFNSFIVEYTQEEIQHLLI